MSSSNVQIYDLEVFPNYFLAGFCDVEGNNTQFFEICDVEGYEVNEAYSLIDFVSDKWLVGFNSRHYDNQIIHFLMKSGDKFLQQPPLFIAQRLFKLSVDIIENENHEYAWNLPFNVLDLKRIGNIDKSLKMCGVDLKFYNILDLIRAHDEDVKKEEIKGIKFYNNNDLEITTDLYHELREDIEMRRKLSVKYNTDIMDYADSGIADRLLSKFYSERTGLSYWDFKDKKTERGWIQLTDIIEDKIRFSTDKMKDFLHSLKTESIHVDEKFQHRLLIGDTYYDMLKGGLHSVREPEIFQATEDVDLVDADVSSYYPNFMINFGVYPEHLEPEFLEILKDITYTRLKAKKAEDWVTSDGLKITINSVFGKMGFFYSWMYDPKAMFSVTINCQLFLLMLIEMLEEHDFKVIYGNTDGITTYVPKSRRDEYNYLCKRWQEYTDFELEFVDYQKAVIRDVNNYIIEKKDSDEPKMKGTFDTERWKSFRKGYEYPVVPHAVREYFINGTPVEVSIQNHQDILDFCIAQKAGRKFDIIYYWNDNGQLKEKKVQKTNRYYIGKGGGSLVKRSKKREISMVAGEPLILLNKHDEDKPIESYNIKYQYYIREAYKIINEFKTKQQSLF